MSKLITLSKLKTALTPLIALINKKAERPNWNENNYDSVSYIENRPFYSEEKETTLCKDVQFYAGDQWIPLGYFAFVKGQNYTVIFDGETYNCVAYKDGHGTIDIGDITLMEESHPQSQDVPFFIFSEEGYGAQIYFEDASIDHTITITGTKEVITKIPKKYLPEISSVGKESGGYNAEIFNDYNNNYASGEYAHAEGYATQAPGNYSHAEGSGSAAPGDYSHAEGYNTRSVGKGSHTEGYGNAAHGEYSHVEGYNNSTVGDYSHVEGYFTKAESDYQHVQGKYNVFDNKDKYAHIVGNGTGGTTSERSNAHTIAWDGTGWFKGDVYVGGTGQDDINAKKLATEESVTSIVTNQIEPLQSSVNTLNTNVSSHETRISSAETYISSPRKGIPMLDEINGYTYILTMRNGELVTYIGTDHIEVTQMPNKTTYVEGEYIDIEGMVVMAYGQDGSSKEITSVVELSSVSSNGEVDITYTESGYVFTTIINVEAAPFDPVTTLIDFNYTDNGDGTYTITGWKGTTNGVAGTEIIIPNNNKIIV